MKRILVTGGSGMVGNELKVLLPGALYPSSTELNLLDANSISNYLNNNNFTHVIHLAAYVGSLHNNVENRIEYFDKNIIMNTLLTKLCYESGITNFLGILSNCIYSDKNVNFPITEDMIHEGCPHESLMSYAYAKRAHAVQLDNYRICKLVNFNYLIPCNLYAIPSMKNKGLRHFLNDLIQKIVFANNNNSDVHLFGDGTPLRQFMHARDLAKIIVIFLEKNLSISCNVAPDENISIDDYAKQALEILEMQHIKIKYEMSLQNGQMRKDVSNTLLKSVIKDFEFTPLEKGFRELYNYYSGDVL